MKHFLLLITFLSATFAAHSNEVEKTLAEKYFTLDKVEVIEIHDEVESKDFSYNKDNSEASVETTEANPDDKEDGIVELIGTGIDSMLLYGKKIWNIITSGKPTGTQQHIVPLSVIPNIDGQTGTLYEMENWELPKSRKFKVNYKNLLGVSVVSFTYSVNYQAGGSHNGKGKWLTGINVSASEVSVMWGFGFDATSSLVGVTNMGTKENPIAAATLKVSWELSSVLQNVKGSESFHITGDNRLIPVTE
jgi:hypothetical protein